jgi:hypothetical protein
MKALPRFIIFSFLSSCAGKSIVDRPSIDPSSKEFRNGIKLTVIKNRYEIKNCYDRELNQSPNVQGKMIVKFTIVNDGKVRVPGGKVLRSELNNSNIENCVISELKKMNFPDPGKDNLVEIVYPFLFSRSDSKTI